MANLEDLTIKEARKRLDTAKSEIAQLAAIFGETPEKTEAAEAIGKIGRPVIVRSRDAGVIFGEYAGHSGDTVSLKKARQLWNWTALKGGTLLDCAQHGVSKGMFSHENDAVTIFNACTLIDCTDEAAKTIKAIDVSFS